MFEHRLLEARKQKGMTQKQVAEAAEVHVASYSAYETNKKVPPADILLRIAKVLGVSVDWLCGGQKEIKVVPTYGDLARGIVSIIRTLENDCVIYTDFDARGEYAAIEINDKTLTSFVEMVKKFEEMAKGSADIREMYFAWIDKRLEELDKMPIIETVDNDLPY